MKDNLLPTVDIIIPCRNEEKYIATMLRSVIDQDYDKAKLLIWIVDGESSDKTCEVVRNFSVDHPNIRLLTNPARTTPHALNIGIKNSHSDFVVRMDCHADYPRDYVKTLVENALKYNADNIGATLETLPGSKGAKAGGIALALSLPISVGNSMFRIGGKSVQEVDTVPFGCFKREIFERIGYFDEEMLRNQDDEFNARIIKMGGKILLLPFLVVKYFARSNFKSLGRMYFQYGQYKLRSNLKSNSIVSIRQFAPTILILGILFFKLFLLVSGIQALAFLPEVFYLIVLFSYYSFSKNPLLKNAGKLEKFFALCASVVIHFSYGAGFFVGVWEYFRKIKNSDLQLSR